MTTNRRKERWVKTLAVLVSVAACRFQGEDFNPWLQLHVVQRQMHFSSIHFVFALSDHSSFMSKRREMPLSVTVNLNTTTRLQIRCLCCTHTSIVWITWILLCSNERKLRISLKVAEGCYYTVMDWLYFTRAGFSLSSDVICTWNTLQGNIFLTVFCADLKTLAYRDLSEKPLPVSSCVCNDPLLKKKLWEVPEANLFIYFLNEAFHLLVEQGFGWQKYNCLESQGTTQTTQNQKVLFEARTLPFTVVCVGRHWL